VHVGGGDGGLADMLYKLKEDFPGKVNVYPHPNFVLPRLMFAGCDLMLFPSRFEPCGIAQIEAMRYGAVPVVRKIGGLADTVENFDTVKRTGNGFVFKDFNEFALFGQIVRAIEVFNNKLLWRDLQQNAMKSDYGWQYSSKEYERLYGTAINFKNEKHLSNSP